MDEKKNHLRINGSADCGGGEFSDVRISGTGKITGDVQCELMYINGSGKIEGDLDCQLFSINGTGKVSGAVKADSFICNGSANVIGPLSGKELKVNGSIQATKQVRIEQIAINGNAKFEADLLMQHLHVPGMLKVNGSVSGHQLSSYGRLHIQHNVEVESFQAKGVFIIGGLLNAGNIDISLYSHSNVREIGGEHITIKRADENLLQTVLKKFFDWSGTLEADLIEGDEIHLECTNARMVRGNKIVIGQGCKIETVEYTESLDIIDGGKVITHEKQS